MALIYTFHFVGRFFLSVGVAREFKKICSIIYLFIYLFYIFFVRSLILNWGKSTKSTR